MNYNIIIPTPPTSRHTLTTRAAPRGTQTLGNNLCVGGSLRVSVIAYLLGKDSLKAWALAVNKA